MFSCAVYPEKAVLCSQGRSIENTDETRKRRRPLTHLLLPLRRSTAIGLLYFSIPETCRIDMITVPILIKYMGLVGRAFGLTISKGDPLQIGTSWKVVS